MRSIPSRTRRAHFTQKLAFAKDKCEFLWQGMRDSNPRKRSQSPVCYRYTNPLYSCSGAAPESMIYYTAIFQNVKHFFVKAKIFRAFSWLIIELNVINADDIALFDAHFLQTVKKSALPQLAVKIHPGLIIVEVDVGNQTLQPGTGHQP